MKLCNKHLLCALTLIFMGISAANADCEWHWDSYMEATNKANEYLADANKQLMEGQNNPMAFQIYFQTYQFYADLAQSEKKQSIEHLKDYNECKGLNRVPTPSVQAVPQYIPQYVPSPESEPTKPKIRTDCPMWNQYNSTKYLPSELSAECNAKRDKQRDEYYKSIAPKFSP